MIKFSIEFGKNSSFSYSKLTFHGKWMMDTSTHSLYILSVQYFLKFDRILYAQKVLIYIMTYLNKIGDKDTI